WQARFFDRFLRKVGDFHEAVEYIHANPVRDGFVTDPAAWRWSSFRHFVGRDTELGVDQIELPIEENRRI
ncbi:MAG: hypothetical protein V3U28_00760, partial [Candidatus Acidoferrales bacterium]